jgi:hypothetical protein
MHPFFRGSSHPSPGRSVSGAFTGNAFPACGTRSVVAAVLLLLLGSAVVGPSSAPAQDRNLSADAEVSLVTILPGDAVHTEFGHSAIHVRDPQRGLNVLFSYGTFDFDDPLFIPKFTYGRLRYFLSVADYRGMIRYYERMGRPVITQQLALSRAQRTALFQFLRTNAQPENRYYQYDFLFDNCSTRIRDALKQALGDAVAFADRPDPDASFRQMLDPYVADRPLLDLGFDLALGTPTDRDVTAREAMFLPEPLMHAFDHASVRTDAGARPLVARTDTLVWFDGYTATERTFDWPTALAWLLLLVGGAWTSLQVWRGDAPGRWADAILLSTVGVVGLVVTFLWFISEHQVTNQNWNLLWAWPTHLVAAGAVARGVTVRGLHGYLALAAAVPALTVVGWPLWPQPLHPAVLPLLLLVALRLGWRTWSTLRPASEPASGGA